MKNDISKILKSSVYVRARKPTRPPVELLKPSAGVVKDYYCLLPYKDEPKIYNLNSELKQSAGSIKKPRKNKAVTNAGSANGTSMLKERAFWKLIGESIERYSLQAFGNTKLSGSFEQLSQGKIPLLDPERITSMEKHKVSDSRRKANINWCNGYNLTQRTTCLIPTQLISVPIQYNDEEKIWRSFISTGAAAGSSLASAVYGGICEVIERDAFMVCWLKQLRLKRITGFEKELYSISHPRLQLFRNTLEEIKLFSLAPEFYVLPDDTPLHTVMCVLRGNPKQGPPITLGYKTQLSIWDAMLGALEETIQLRPMMKAIYLKRKKRPVRVKSPGQITTIDQRANLWLTPSAAKILNSWLSKSKAVSFNSFLATRLNYKLGDLVTALHKKKATVYFVEMTHCLPAAIRRSGLRTAKVIIPEYQPLYLNESQAVFVTERLASAEKRLKAISLMKGNKLQRYSHPML